GVVAVLRPDRHAMKAVDRVLAWDAGCLSPGGPRFGPGVADELQHQPIVVLEGNHLPRWPLKRDSVTHQPLDPESQRARQHGERLIRIAVQPALTRFRRRDHRMAGRPRVLAGVPVGGVIAALGRAALLTGTQVDPPRTDLHALLALAALRVPDGGNRGDVNTRLVGH